MQVLVKYSLTILLNLAHNLTTTQCENPTCLMLTAFVRRLVFAFGLSFDVLSDLLRVFR